MGIFNKLKNVLFEEEEVEIPVLTKSEPKQKQKHHVDYEKDRELERELERSPREIDEDDYEARIKENRSVESSHLKNIKRDFDFDDEEMEKEMVEDDKPEIEPVKEEDNSPFLSFDEDEFERINSRNHPVPKPEVRPIKVAPKNVVPEEPKVKPEPPKRFKPSPIISPVYGILDKNYKKEDIVERTEDNSHIIEEPINVDTVRRKAYGTLEDDIEITLNIPAIKNSDIDIKIDTNVKKDEEEKSIDDLLVDTMETSINDATVEENIVHEPSTIEDELESSAPILDSIDEDDEIDVPVVEPTFEEPLVTEDIDDLEVADENVVPEGDDELPSFEEINNQEEDSSYDEDLSEEILEKTNTLKILDEIEKELNGNTKTDEELVLENTSETDLFNLIDSMYENKEEEEDE